MLHLQYPGFGCLAMTISGAHKKSRQTFCISHIGNAVAKKKNAKESAKSFWPSPEFFLYDDDRMSRAAKRMCWGEGSAGSGDTASTCSSQLCQCGGSCLPALTYMLEEKANHISLWCWLWLFHPDLCQSSQFPWISALAFQFLESCVFRVPNGVCSGQGSVVSFLLHEIWKFEGV